MVMVLKFLNFPNKLSKNDELKKYKLSGSDCNEVKKSIFISAPYFRGLSESFKQLFKYTHIQVCFKGQNTEKSMLMHPKEKVDPSLQKDIVYQWSCTNLAINHHI